MIIESAESKTASYEQFLAADGARLRRLLVAHYGTDVGTEVNSDMLAWAWEHWGELASVTNRLGLLYRVAQSKSRRYWRWRRRPAFPPEAPIGPCEPEPGLPSALARLPEAHRVAVLSSTPTAGAMGRWPRPWGYRCRRSATTSIAACRSCA